MNRRAGHILLVEDDAVDAEAVRRAFDEHGVDHPFTVVSDGLEALKVLRGEASRPRLPRPYLILLDLNMPRMNGIEFLQALRADPELKTSVVFVLTTSDRDEDKLAAYCQQVAGYLLKTKAGTDFGNLVTLLNAYWRVVEPPPEAQPC